jgi:hypothetical protein
MASKFTMAVRVKNGKIAESVIVFRKDGLRAQDQFKAWREEGEEAYLFQAPEADKRSSGKNDEVEIPEAIVKAVEKMVKPSPAKGKSVAIDIE